MAESACSVGDVSELPREPFQPPCTPAPGHTAAAMVRAALMIEGVIKKEILPP